MQPLSDAELDEMLPSEGYKIVDAPADYVPIRSNPAKLMATPTPMTAAGFSIADSEDQFDAGGADYESLQAPGDLPDLKPEDRPYFGKILDDNIDDSGLSPGEVLLFVCFDLILFVCFDYFDCLF